MGLLLLVLVVLAAAAPPLPSPELLGLPALDRRGQLLQAETDPPLRRVHPDDHERQLIPHVHDILGAAHRPVGHLRDVQQPVDPRLQLHESPEAGEAHDLPRHPRHPAGQRSATTSPGSGWICFTPSEMRLASRSTLRISVWICCPFFRRSEGWPMLRVHDMSEMCRSPSTPGSSSTKAPKSVRFRTCPWTRMPGLYHSSMVPQGSGSTCFIPRESRFVALLTSRTMTSTGSPTLTSLEGCLTRRVQDISET